MGVKPLSRGEIFQIYKKDIGEVLPSKSNNKAPTEFLYPDSLSPLPPIICGIVMSAVWAAAVCALSLTLNCFKEALGSYVILVISAAVGLVLYMALALTKNILSNRLLEKEEQKLEQHNLRVLEGLREASVGINLLTNRCSSRLIFDAIKGESSLELNQRLIGAQYLKEALKYRWMCIFECNFFISYVVFIASILFAAQKVFNFGFSIYYLAIPILIDLAVNFVASVVIEGVHRLIQRLDPDLIKKNKRAMSELARPFGFSIGLGGSWLKGFISNPSIPNLLNLRFEFFPYCQRYRLMLKELQQIMQAIEQVSELLPFRIRYCENQEGIAVNEIRLWIKSDKPGEDSYSLKFTRSNVVSTKLRTIFFNCGLNGGNLQTPHPKYLFSGELVISSQYRGKVHLISGERDSGDSPFTEQETKKYEHIQDVLGLKYHYLLKSLVIATLRGSLICVDDTVDPEFCNHILEIVNLVEGRKKNDPDLIEAKPAFVLFCNAHLSKKRKKKLSDKGVSLDLTMRHHEETGCKEPSSVAQNLFRSPPVELDEEDDGVSMNNNLGEEYLSRCPSPSKVHENILARVDSPGAAERVLINNDSGDEDERMDKNIHRPVNLAQLIAKLKQVHELCGEERGAEEEFSEEVMKYLLQCRSRLQASKSSFKRVARSGKSLISNNANLVGVEKNVHEPVNLAELTAELKRIYKLYEEMRGAEEELSEEVKKSRDYTSKVIEGIIRCTFISIYGRIDLNRGFDEYIQEVVKLICIKSGNEMLKGVEVKELEGVTLEDIEKNFKDMENNCYNFLEITSIRHNKHKGSFQWERGMGLDRKAVNNIIYMETYITVRLKLIGRMRKVQEFTRSQPGRWRLHVGDHLNYIYSALSDNFYTNKQFKGLDRLTDTATPEDLQQRFDKCFEELRDQYSKIKKEYAENESMLNFASLCLELQNYIKAAASKGEKGKADTLPGLCFILDSLHDLPEEIYSVLKDQFNRFGSSTRGGLASLDSVRDACNLSSILAGAVPGESRSGAGN